MTLTRGTPVYSHHQGDFVFVEPDDSYVFRPKHVDYFVDRQIVELGGMLCTFVLLL